MSSKTAHRYAKALLEHAVEKNVLENVFEDIVFIKNTFDDSAELIRFFKNPIIKKQHKNDVLETLFKDKISKDTYRLISLVIKNNRDEILPEITISFVELYNEYSGILNIDVYTAEPLSSVQKSNLVDSLNKLTGKSVTLSEKENPELLGGLAVRIDDTVIDGTVKHKIEQLKNLFSETTV